MLILQLILNGIQQRVSKSGGGESDEISNFESYITGNGNDILRVGERGTTGAEQSLGRFKKANLGGGNNQVDFSSINSVKYTYEYTYSNGVLNVIEREVASAGQTGAVKNTAQINSSTKIGNIALANNTKLNTFTYNANGNDLSANSTTFMNVVGSAFQDNDKYIFNFNDANGVIGALYVVDSNNGTNISQDNAIALNRKGLLALKGFGTFNITTNQNITVEVADVLSIKNYTITGTGAVNKISYEGLSIAFELSVVDNTKRELSLKTGSKATGDEKTYNLNGFNSIVLGLADDTFALKEVTTTGVTYFTVNGGDGNDTLSLGGYSAKVDVNFGSSGFNVQGYSISNFEIYGLTNFDDTLKINDGSSLSIKGGDGTDSVSYVASNGTGDTILNFVVDENLVKQSNVVYNYTWVVIKSIGAPDTLTNFESIVLSKQADIYNVGSYTYATLSLLAKPDFKVTIDFVSDGTTSTIDSINFASSMANTIEYLLGGALATVITSTYVNNSNQIKTIHNVKNEDEIFGHSGEDIFKIESATFGGATNRTIAIDAFKDSANNELRILGTDPKTLKAITLDLSLNVNKAYQTPAPSNAPSGIQLTFANISIIKLADEDDTIIGKGTGSYSFYVGGGNNSFSYSSNSGLSTLNITYNYDTSLNLETYEFDKGKSNIDTVYGSISNVNLNELDNIFTLESYDQTAIINRTIDGKSGNDTLAITPTVVYSNLELDFGTSVALTLRKDDTTTTTIDETSKLTFNNFENYKFSGNLVKLRLASSLSQKIPTPILQNLLSTDTIQTLEIYQDSANTQGANVTINLTTGVIETTTTSTTNFGTTYTFSKYTGKINGLSDVGLNNKDNVLVDFDQSFAMNITSIDVGGDVDTIDLKNNGAFVNIKSVLLSNRYIITENSSGSGKLNVVNGENFLLSNYGDFASITYLSNDVFLDGGAGNDKLTVIAKQLSNSSTQPFIFISSNVVVIPVQNNGANSSSVETYNLTVSNFEVLSIKDASIRISSDYKAGNLILELENPSEVGFDLTSSDVAVVISFDYDELTQSGKPYTFIANILAQVVTSVISSVTPIVYNLTGSDDIINIGDIFTTISPVAGYVAPTINAGDGYNILNYTTDRLQGIGKTNFTLDATNADFYSILNGQTTLKVNKIDRVDFKIKGSNVDMNTQELKITGSGNFVQSYDIDMGRGSGSGFNEIDKIILSSTGTNIIYDLSNLSYRISKGSGIVTITNAKDLTLDLGVALKLTANISGNLFDISNTYTPNITAQFDVKDDVVYLPLVSAINVTIQESLTTTNRQDNIKVLLSKTINPQPAANLALNLFYVDTIHFAYSETFNVTYLANIAKAPGVFGVSHTFYLSQSGGAPGTITVNTNEYRVNASNLVGSVKVYKTNVLTDASFDQFYGASTVMFSGATDLLVGNTQYTMQISRQAELKEESGMQISSKLSHEEDGIFIQGMIDNYVIDTGVGYDNIFVAGNAAYYDYIYSTEKTYIIDGQRYDTGGNFVIVSDNQGHKMLLLNTSLDEISGIIYSRSGANSNVLPVINVAEQGNVEPDLYVKPEGSVGKRSLDIVDTNNDGLKDYSDEQNVSNYYSLNYNADNYVRPNAKPNVGVNNNQSNTNSQDNNTDTNNTNDNATTNDNNTTNNNMSGDANSQDSNNTNNNEGSVKNKSRKIEDNEDLAIDDMLDSSSKEEERVENELLGDILLSDVLGEEIDLDNLNLDSENSSEDDRIDIGNISSETSTSQSDIEDNYKLEDENKNDVLDDLNNILRKNHDNSLN
jgi:hypothetical protein